jgi:hypothetical protein
LYIAGHLSSTTGDIKIKARNIILAGSLNGEEIDIQCDNLYANNTALERLIKISAGLQTFQVNENQIFYDKNQEEDKDFVKDRNKKYDFLKNSCLKEEGAIFGSKISMKIKNSAYFWSTLLVSEKDIDIECRKLLHVETKRIIEARAYQESFVQKSYHVAEKLGPNQYIFSKEGKIQITGEGDFMCIAGALTGEKMIFKNKGTPTFTGHVLSTQWEKSGFLKPNN